MTAAIRVHGLSHAFGTGESARQVLSALGFAIAAGEMVALVGASGSGKTTLLTLLGALRAVQQGEVEVLGMRLDGAAEEARLALRKRLGFIFQAHHLHPCLTARESLRMGLDVHGPCADADARCLDMLARLGLGDRGAALPAALSGGQRQRVAIGRALVGRPRLVLADEPTAALDAESGQAVLDLLRARAVEEGMTSLIVTHDVRVLDRMDRVLELRDGRILRDRATATAA